MSKNPNPSLLDATQIIKRAFDESSDRIRVESTATIEPSGPIEVTINHQNDSIALGDGTKLVTSTAIGPNVGLDVNLVGGIVSGQFSQTGLSNQGRITTMLIGDVATPIPVSPLPQRNSLSLVNLSTTDSFYIGFSSSVLPGEALGTTSGWEIRPDEGFNLDIRDNITLYGITEPGITLKIKVMELA